MSSSTDGKDERKFSNIDGVVAYIRGHDLLCGTDVPDAIEALLQSVLNKAIDRAKENGRKTVRGTDI